MTLGQKLVLAFGILTRYGAHQWSRHYDSRYDVNHDRRIDGSDVEIVLDATICHPKFRYNGYDGDDRR